MAVERLLHALLVQGVANEADASRQHEQAVQVPDRNNIRNLMGRELGREQSQ